MTTETKRPDTSEIGTSGTTFFSGSLAENEYNTDLRGAKGRAIYDKMWRSDARIAACLLFRELPLRGVPWSVEPASEDAQDVEIAEALEDNLFEGMSPTWDSFLQHVFLMHKYGFSIFEKVWEITDEGIRFAKLAPRLPSSLYQWDLDETGGLKGIIQFVQVGSTFKFVPIPVEKLLVFTHGKQGANFEGVPVLRAAYQSWFYKTNMYRIDGIALERHALGILTFTTPTGAEDAEKKRVDEMGKRLYAHEQAWVRLTEGYTLDVKGLTGTVRETLPSAEMHNKAIAEAILGDDLLGLGSGDTGSWALSKDKSSSFMLRLKADVTNITDTMNAYAIKPWVDYNYNVEKYPKLTCGKLETRDIEKYVTAVGALITAGGLTSDRDTENTLREALELPELPEEVPTSSESKAAAAEAFAKAQAERPVVQPIPPGQQATPEGQQPVDKATGKPIPVVKASERLLTPAEQCVNFAEIEDTLDKAEQDAIAAVSLVQSKQIAKLVDVAMNLVTKRDFDRLTDIDVPFRAEVASAIELQLLKVYEYGRQQVRQELAKQGIKRRGT
jgi:phage gp29-like protein